MPVSCFIVRTEKKVKAPKLPAKWRTPQELYAEDKLAWNLTETGSSAKASGVAALRKSILQDTVAKWNSISAEDRQPFEDKAAGVHARLIEGALCMRCERKLCCRVCARRRIV